MVDKQKLLDILISMEKNVPYTQPTFQADGYLLAISNFRGAINSGTLSPDASPEGVMFTEAEINLFRQWYNAVKDANPGYLTTEDERLAGRLTKPPTEAKAND